MKKTLTALVLFLLLGYTDYNASAAEKNSINTLDETNVENLAELGTITPLDASKPQLENPYAGTTFTSFGPAMSVGGRTSFHSTSTASALPNTSIKFSSKDLLYGGAIKQRRYYDEFGDAIKDIDYFHGGTGHTFPHIHYFNWYNSVPRSGPYPAQF